MEELAAIPPGCFVLCLFSLRGNIEVNNGQSMNHIYTLGLIRAYDNNPTVNSFEYPESRMEIKILLAIYNVYNLEDIPASLFDPFNYAHDGRMMLSPTLLPAYYMGYLYQLMAYFYMWIWFPWCFAKRAS